MSGNGDFADQLAALKSVRAEAANRRAAQMAALTQAHDRAVANVDKAAFDAASTVAKRQKDFSTSSGDEKVTSGIKAAGTSDLLQGLDVTGKALNLPFSAIATLGTLPRDDYEQATPDGGTKPLSEISIVDRLVGDNQLGLSSLIKAWTTTPDEQRRYAADNASVGTDAKMFGAEALGALGTVLLDPFQKVGQGAGMAHDLVETAGSNADDLARLGERVAAASEGSSSRALADAARLIDEHAATLASGLDEAGKAAAVSAFDDAIARVAGDAVASGDNAFQQARYHVGDTIHHAPTSKLDRSSFVADRVDRVVNEVAKARDLTFAEASNLPLDAFGGRTAAEMTRDAYVGGYGRLGDAGANIGVTPRLSFYNTRDVFASPLSPHSLWNPFASEASATTGTYNSILDQIAQHTPTAWARGQKAAGADGVRGALASVFAPSVRGSAKIWEAAVKSVDNPEMAISDIARIMGVSEHQLTKGNPEEFAKYPFMLLKGARMQRVVDNAAKSLATEVARTEAQMSHVLAQSAAEDFTPVGWQQFDYQRFARQNGAAEDVLSAVDGAATGGGKIREDIGKAVYEAVKAEQIAPDLATQGATVLERTRNLVQRLFGNEDFAARLANIADRATAPVHTAFGGSAALTREDVARSVVNAVGNAVTLAERTAGGFDWIEGFRQPSIAKQLFTGDHASSLGRTAVAVRQLTDAGLMVLFDNPEGFRNAEQLAALVAEQVDVMTGAFRAEKAALHDLATAQIDQENNLKKLGVLSDAAQKASENTTRAHADEAALLTDDLRRELDAVRQLPLDEQNAAIAALASRNRLLAQVENSRTTAIAASKGLDEDTASVALNQAQLESLRQRIEDNQMYGQHLDRMTVRVDKAQGELAKFLDPRLEGPVDLAAGSDVGTDSLLYITPGRPGQRARIQALNDFRRNAAGVFGDALDSTILDTHAIPDVTLGFGKTEGAFNSKTISRFLEKNLPERSRVWLREQGVDLNTLVARADDGQYRGVWAQLKVFGAEVRGENAVNKLDALGIDTANLRKEILSTVAVTARDVTEIGGQLVRVLTGGVPDVEALVTMLSGATGREAFIDTLSNNFDWLQRIVDSAERTLSMTQVSLGMISDRRVADLVPRLIMEMPEVRASFEGLRTMLDDLSGAVNVFKARGTAEALVQDVFSSTGSAEAVRAMLVNNDRHAVDTTLRHLGQTSEVLGQLLYEMDGQRLSTRALQAAQQEAVNRVVEMQAIVEQGRDAITARMPDVYDAGIATLSAIQSAPNGGHVFGAWAANNRTLQEIAGGFDAFTLANRVSDKGVVRSDAQLATMWGTRLENAAKLTERWRDRLLENPGKLSEQFARNTDKQYKDWLLENGLVKFKAGWRVGQQPEAGAEAFLAMVGTRSPGRQTAFTDGLDALAQMLRTGYVSTPGFSPGNFMGATIENLRQGTRPSVTRKVWAADYWTRTLDQIETHAVAALSGEEQQAALQAVAKWRSKVADLYGQNMVDHVREAYDVGVGESSKFAEAAGMRIDTTAGTAVLGGKSKLRRGLGSWREQVAEAWRAASLKATAAHGRSPVLESVSAVTAAIGAVPAVPAAAWERSLAGTVERLARKPDFAAIAGADKDLFTRLIAQSADFAHEPGIESLVRVDLFTQKRLGGFTVNQAFDKVLDSHFDYGDLSKFDNVMRRIVPFWSWKSRSNAHFFELLAHRPSTVLPALRLQSETHQSQDQTRPMWTMKASGGYKNFGSFGVGSRPLDPAADGVDTIGLLEEGGPAAVLADAFKNDTNALFTTPAEVVFQKQLSGADVNTPASGQRSIQALYDNDSTRPVVESLFERKANGGKWYWRDGNAVFVGTEALPFLNTLSGIVQSYDDSDSLPEGTATATLRLFGAPVRPVPPGEQTRARTGAELRRKIESQNQSDKKAR